MSFSDSKVVRDVTLAGALAAADGVFSFVVPFPAQLVGVYVSVGTAPSGGTGPVFEVNKNAVAQTTLTLAPAAVAASKVFTQPVTVASPPAQANFASGYYVNQGVESHTAQTGNGDPTLGINSQGQYVEPNFTPLASFAAGDTFRLDINSLGGSTATANTVVSLVFDPS